MPRPGRFTPGKGPVPIVQEAGWAPGPVWKGAEYPTILPFIKSIIMLSYARLRKGKGRPLLHQWWYRVCMYSSTLSLTSAPDEVGRSAPRPGVFRG